MSLAAWKVRIATGIIEGEPQNYIKLIADAGQAVGRDCLAKDIRERLVKAIKQNLTARKQNKIDDLIYTYDLGMSSSTFKRYKAEFLEFIAKRLRL